jgi:uncharacterized protein YgiM (DUF1202 family)
MILLRKLKKAAAIVFIASMLLCVGLVPNAAAAEVTSAAGTVTTTWGALNVRTEPNVSSSIITKLPSGTYVTLVSKAGSWWCVEYAPLSYGYVSADYIKYVDGAYALVTSTSSGNLNVRSGPGTSYGIIVPFPAGGWFWRLTVTAAGTGSFITAP